MVDAQIWETGVVVITGNYEIVGISDFNDPKPSTMANLKMKEMPQSWTIVPPEKSLSRHVEVLVALQSTILVVDSAQALDQV